MQAERPITHPHTHGLSEIIYVLMGARDGRTQFARASLLFFSFTPNPSPKKPKNLKPNTLFFFFITNSGINPGQPVGKGREKKKKEKKPWY